MPRSRATAVLVDLSWTVDHDYFSFRFSPADLWERHIAVNRKGRPMETLSRETLLPYYVHPFTPLQYIDSPDA